jgi:hypothetical protein
MDGPPRLVETFSVYWFYHITFLKKAQEALPKEIGFFMQQPLNRH